MKNLIAMIIIIPVIIIIIIITTIIIIIIIIIMDIFVCHSSRKESTWPMTKPEQSEHKHTSKPNNSCCPTHIHTNKITWT